MAAPRRRGATWEITIERGYHPVTGKRDRDSRTFRGTKKEALAEERRLLRERDLGTYVEPNGLTVQDHLERWLHGARGNLALKTLERYEDIIAKHLVPGLGPIPLDKLRPAHIQDYYTKARESGRLDGRGGLSAKTVLHYHRLLHLALEEAVNWQLIARNPCDAVKPPRAEYHEMHVLTQEQISRLLTEATSAGLQVPLLVSVTTGVRRGELLGLRWQDVDLEAQTLTVRQSLVESRSGELTFKQPKTPKSRRRISLPPSVTRALREHRRSQAEVRLALGNTYQDFDLVVTRPDGRPCSPDAFSKAFHRLSHRLDLGVRLHDLRHTHATMLLQQNIHPKVVSERLGHATVGLTLDTYSHVLEGMDREAANCIDGLLSLPTPTAAVDGVDGKRSATPA